MNALKFLNNDDLEIIEVKTIKEENKIKKKILV
jgi:hypothetical protein